MERITSAYPTLHSSEVINEEGLMWRVRVLRGEKRAGAHTPSAGRPSISRWTRLRSSLAENGVMLAENIGAIIKAGPNLIAGRGRKRSPDNAER